LGHLDSNVRGNGFGRARTDQLAEHRFRMADARQRSWISTQVEAGQHSLNAVTVAFNQLRHPSILPTFSRTFLVSAMPRVGKTA
jgi:hypothetical protein